MRLTMSEIASACNGRAENISDAIVTGVSTDSRKITHGCVFFALRGASFDGHDFAEQALQGGAACVVVDILQGAYRDLPYIKVADTGQALLDLAAYYRRQFPDTKVVAVTGSAGKTTTKDMIASVLGQKYQTQKTIGNYNNHIGVPLTLFQLRPGDQAIVVEMGMNHANEINKLSITAMPDLAVITNIGDAHIENFDSREGILRAKLEITEGLKKDGVLIVNGDDPLLKRQGHALHCHVNPNAVTPLGIKGIRYQYGNEAWHIPLPGAHMVSNALLAAKVGELLGLDPRQIGDGIAAFTPSGDRMEFIDTNSMTVINDVYNANPTSMKAALDILQYAEGRKVAVLGDMYELGSHARALHAEVGRFAARQGVVLVAIGTLAKYIAEGYDSQGPTTPAFYFAQKSAFCARSKELLRPGDTVLLKASNGMKFIDIVRHLQADAGDTPTKG